MEFVSISKLSRFKDKIMGLLNQKAPLQSPSFTGSPTTPTPTQSTTGKVLVNQEYVANSVSGYLPLTGGTMTGSLVLNAAPTADLEAANKKYVDDTVLGAKPLAKELHFYGGCLSAANEANKVVTVSDDNFKLMSGVAVDVSFLNANTASRPTLNVNNTGAVEIKAYSTTVPLANQWRQGAVVRFVYNTSNWVMVDGSVASTTYYGATKLNSSTSSTSEDTAATPLAVKNAYDRGSTALTVASAAVPKSNLLRFTNVTFAATTGVTDTTSGRVITIADIPALIPQPLDVDKFIEATDNKYPEIYRVFKFYTDKGYIIYSEIGAYLMDYLVSGTIDIFCYRPTDFVILDWKTNRDGLKFEAGYYKKDKTTIPNQLTNEWIPQPRKKMLPPVSHLADCNGMHYSLQLSMYAIMAEIILGIPCYGLGLCHIGSPWITNKYGQPLRDEEGYHVDPNGEETINWFKINYLRNEVIALLKDREYKLRANKKTINQQLSLF